MKQKILLIGLTVLISLSTFAKQVDELTAKMVGQNFLQSRTSSPTLKNATSFQLVYKAKSQNINPLGSIQETNFFYVFNTNANGFIIVAGDDKATPILGYSDQGLFDPSNISPSVAKWLEGYKKQIRIAIDQNIAATNEVSEDWQSLKANGNNGSAKSMLSVNPLMQTQWDQAPFYNSLCPNNSVTGCVATAMAQIMKYWNYPATGSGFHSYNHPTYGTLSANFGSTSYQWSSMPNSVNSTNNAVATLMYQVGVSVDMNYSPQVSGAYVISAQSPVVNCSEYALETYFNYNSTLQGIERVNYTTTQWVNLLKAELDANRPVLYAGFGTGGGHCFVADGYDINDYIHFNWGWGGAYDGFFQIDALDPSGTGTGGGSGGYNSGHQAVIGIEPPTGSQTFNMELYNNVIPSSSTIFYGQAFTVETNIANTGANTFNGDYTAAIFDNSLNFIDYVEILTGYTLQGSFAYQNNLVFSTTGLFSMLPGNYYVGIFYRPTGDNWQQVANSGSYTNLVPMTVINPNDIELNSSITVTPGNILVQGQSASATLNIVNDGLNTFFGDYEVGLYNLDGTFAQTIGALSETNGLPSGFTYLSPFLTFTAASITVNPGTYLLAVLHNPNNSGWQLTGSSYFTNPITVTVVAPTLQPDIYEVNNSLNTSYDLPVSFSGNSATINTTGSNCHITTDNDYFKVVLPSGFQYTVIPRIHDSYNSGNGLTYSLDGLFSYSTDGVLWSDAFDDVIVGNITITGAATIYFRIAPYFAGETGTYLLDMSITRSSVVGVQAPEMQNAIHVYPNPAKEVLKVDLDGINHQVKQADLVSIQGQTVFISSKFDNSKTFTIPLADIADGVYFLKIQTNEGTTTKKVVVAK